ncbi:ATP-binding protein [Plantibacter sp. T3]|uniref:ATP-binding protein n=1 Tax=Plantibacter sp. T3 TaxID=2653161 RepID=UPI0012F45967|nr:ATP-binding protein [Plantibacter sp. T3]VXB08331.1 conserved hypothetical protein [Plantibacter sp. T3]
MDIDIRPEVNILAVLRHLNYKPWFALAEYVDNSLGSYLASTLPLVSQPLSVDITIEREGAGRIVVRDNAAGIRAQDFARAFRAAQVPPDRSGLSEFGMGMKSASSWFARKWRVRTSVMGEPIERAIDFDLQAISSEQIDRLHVVETPALSSSHFTEIVLEDLNHVPQYRTMTKIRDHLSSIYRSFLRDQTLQLSFQGEQLRYNEVESLVASPASKPQEDVVRWKKTVDFTMRGGQRVTGFAGVRAVGSTAHAGFALMRRGRLIVGSHDDPYRPSEIFGQSNSYVYQRLFGELTLEGFEVSHTKDGIRWEEDEAEFLTLLATALRKAPLDLLSQASNFRAKSIVDKVRPIERATTEVQSSVSSRFSAVATEILADNEPDQHVPDDLPPSAPKSIHRFVDVVVAGQPWRVDLRATLDEAMGDWIQVGAMTQSTMQDGPRTVVQISISLAHPFSQKFIGSNNENTEAILSMATAFGLALALGKQNGAKSYSILQHMNTLARKTFTGNE